ncbi:hypothetical protein [Flavitalea sp.]|nr:hypothetical protein [Flavitalea sp.]
MKKLLGSFRGYVNIFPDQIFIIGQFESFPNLNLIKINWDTPAQTFNSGYMKLVNSTWRFGSLTMEGFVANDTDYSEQVMSIVMSAYHHLENECDGVEKKSSSSIQATYDSKSGNIAC